jgi:hypothetical protein
MSKIVNFRTDEDDYIRFKELMLKEKRSIQEAFNSLMNEYVRSKIKNPQFKIDEFETIDSRMPLISDSIEEWEKYLKSLDVNEYKEFDSHLNKVLNVHNRALKHLR